MSPRLRWRRSLALRTVIGVVVLVALVLAAMGTTTALIAQRTLSAQLDDSVRQAMSRSWNFLGDQGGGPGAAQPSSPAEPSEAPEPSGAAEPSDVADPTSAADPADDGQRDPLAAPGQPVGVLALVQEDGRTTSARYLGEDGEIRELPAEDVAAIEDSGVLNEAAEPQPWRMGDAPRDYLDEMLRAIVGIEVGITRIEGKRKLSQNRTAPDRDGVIGQLQTRGQQALAEAMRRAAERQPPG